MQHMCRPCMNVFVKRSVLGFYDITHAFIIYVKLIIKECNFGIVVLCHKCVVHKHN